MKFIINIIKGMLIGVANIIPGVSGGTMAVTMGVYDKIINAINNLTKDFKKAFFSLLQTASSDYLPGIYLFRCLPQFSFFLKSL